MQTLVPSSSRLLAFASLAALGLAAAPAHAQTTINFDNFTQQATDGRGYSFIGNTYDTQGFTFNSNDSGLYATAGSVLGDGETSLYSDAGGSVTLTQDNGQTFSLNAIDLGPYAGNSNGTTYDGPTLFTGTKSDGTTVTVTETTTGSQYQTFSFSGFTDLKSLTFVPQNLSAPQFDNVVLTPNAPPPSSVPEPSSLTVMAVAALATVGLILRARKRQSAQTS